MAIWTIVLTIIAMYVAGVETARMSGAVTRHDGVVHGLMMFGLSTVGFIVLAALTGGTLSHGGVNATTHSMWIGLTSGMAWAGFWTLLLGWLAAMGGAASGVGRPSLETRQPVPMRPAV